MRRPEGSQRPEGSRAGRTRVSAPRWPPGGAWCPIRGHPVDDDRGGRRSGWMLVSASAPSSPPSIPPSPLAAAPAASPICPAAQASNSPRHGTGVPATWNAAASIPASASTSPRPLAASTVMPPQPHPVAGQPGQAGNQPPPPGRTASVVGQPPGRCVGTVDGGEDHCGARDQRRGGGRNQPPAAGAGDHRARHQHGKDRDHGGEPAGQHRPQPGGVASTPAAVLPGLPGGRGGRARGQHSGQPGGGEHHRGHRTTRQPGPRRGQQLALRHDSRDQDSDPGPSHRSQPRQPQPVRSTPPTSPATSGARSAMSTAAPRPAPTPPHASGLGARATGRDVRVAAAGSCRAPPTLGITCPTRARRLRNLVTASSSRPA
jgi:hypothetical protein